MIAWTVSDTPEINTSSSIVTTGNRTNMYEVAEAVHRRITRRISTNSPTEPRVTR